MARENELLPIGSVVMLKDSTAPVMIAGFLPVTTEPDCVWDYSGFRFPLGYTDDDDIFCFNQSQITIVYAYGYRDVEHDIFVDSLSDTMDQLRERMENTDSSDVGEAPQESTGDEEE